MLLLVLICCCSPCLLCFRCYGWWPLPCWAPLAAVALLPPSGLLPLLLLFWRLLRVFVAPPSFAYLPLEKVWLLVEASRWLTRNYLFPTSRQICCFNASSSLRTSAVFGHSPFYRQPQQETLTHRTIWGIFIGWELRKQIAVAAPAAAALC